MKKAKIFGVIALILAVVVLAAGVLGAGLESGEGALGGILADAESVQASLAADEKLTKNAVAFVKKAENLEKDVAEAEAKLTEIAAAVEALNAGLLEGTTGVELIDSLYAAVTNARAGVEGADNALAVFESGAGQLLGEGGTLAAAVNGIRESLGTTDTAMGELDGVVTALVQELYAEQYDSAYGAVSKAESAVSKQETDMADVAARAGIDYAPAALEMTAELESGTAQEYAAACTALLERVQGLNANAEALSAAAAEAADYVATMEPSAEYTFAQRIVLLISDYFIGVIFTAALLAVVGIVLLGFAGKFAYAWRKYPTFSVLIALLAMLVVQTYALGFGFETFGEWGQFWVNNALNVLRANASVGIIALGMTLVIITGGIDLAVGSTLAGVGTVVMVLLDTSERGVLGKFGITGMPAYVLGIAGGIATGLVIGAVIGLAVTKGRVPPFIVTLGVMNIVRSVAQYFTKSYSLKIPAEFSNLANYEIFGQRFLPILYWLVLAVIFYIVMRHTSFGRYVYAVGSNERTTRLSGINVNKVKMKVYMLMGLLVSIASITQLARLGNMDVASAGSGYELDAIAAVVVGGTAMSGGKGSILGTVLGVLIIGIMNNLLILLGVDSFLTNAFKGAIIIFAVLMQRKEQEA